jgi:hypothetical protein
MMAPYMYSAKPPSPAGTQTKEPEHVAQRSIEGGAHGTCASTYACSSCPCEPERQGAQHSTGVLPPKAWLRPSLLRREQRLRGVIRMQGQAHLRPQSHQTTIALPSRVIFVLHHPRSPTTGTIAYGS